MGEKRVAENLMLKATGLCKTEIYPSFPLDEGSLLDILAIGDADEFAV